MSITTTTTTTTAPSTINIINDDYSIIHEQYTDYIFFLFNKCYTNILTKDYCPITFFLAPDSLTILKENVIPLEEIHYIAQRKKDSLLLTKYCEEYVTTFWQLMRQDALSRVPPSNFAKTGKSNSF